MCTLDLEDDDWHSVAWLRYLSRLCSAPDGVRPIGELLAKIDAEIEAHWAKLLRPENLDTLARVAQAENRRRPWSKVEDKELVNMGVDGLLSTIEGKYGEIHSRGYSFGEFEAWIDAVTQWIADGRQGQRPAQFSEECSGSGEVVRKSSTRPFHQWWRRRVRNLLQTERRRAKKARLLANPTELASDAVGPVSLTPSDELLRKEQMNTILDSCRQLPVNEQRAIELFYIEGRSWKEIAEELGESELALKKRVSRWRRRLSEQLNEEESK